MSQDSPTPPTKLNAQAASLTDQILEKFVAELSAQKDFGNIAQRLHKTILEDRIISEDSIKTALFSEES